MKKKCLPAGRQGWWFAVRGPFRFISPISIVLIAFALLLMTNSCFNRKKSGPQSGSSASVPGAFNLILPAEGANVNPNVFYPVPSFVVAWTASANLPDGQAGASSYL